MSLARSQAQFDRAYDPGAEMARAWADDRRARLAAIADSLASVERKFRALGIVPDQSNIMQENEHGE